MAIQSQTDNYWMGQALQCARYAYKLGEVPVGAVLIINDRMVTMAHNQPIATLDPTAHAEIVALRTAAIRLQKYRLLEATLYVTLEPCPMCIGACLQARIKRLVFGAYEPRLGAVGSAFNILQTKELIHRPEFTGGILREECSFLLKDFFKRRRAKKK